MKAHTEETREKKASFMHWQAGGEGSWFIELLVLHSHCFLFLQLHCVAAVNLLLTPRIKATVAFLVQVYMLKSICAFDKASFERLRMTYWKDCAWIVRLFSPNFLMRVDTGMIYRTLYDKWYASVVDVIKLDPSFKTPWLRD